MDLRRFRPGEAPALYRLLYDTIHTVCAAGYISAQPDAWAPREPDFAAWDEIFRSRTTLVAEENGTPLGFGSIGTDGYLDLLYVHKDCQRRGIAAGLCDFLKTLYPVDRVTVHASETARPFFEKRGYRVLQPQRVERRGRS